MNIIAISDHIDNYLTQAGRLSIDPIEANALLEKAGLLKDSKDRPGKPLRNLLRKGQLPHAFQSGSKGSKWTIPCSSSKTDFPSHNFTFKKQIKRDSTVQAKQYLSNSVNIIKLEKQLKQARQKYKPNSVKFLLIAEAPPDRIERFFYYKNVRGHDYLFLGVAEALYPQLKDSYLSSGRSSNIKESILKKFQEDGFYLLDLSELPLSLMQGDLYSQLPPLKRKIDEVATTNTNIILIKATVYDIAFQYLIQNGIKNVVDIRIPFPGQGGQKLFQTGFKKALKKIGYL